jgi:hypothetical protein
LAEAAQDLIHGLVDAVQPPFQPTSIRFRQSLHVADGQLRVAANGGQGINDEPC